ncbi:MAG TPA: DUF3311 domain-containing protein [Verrucomicrobiae bacterium]|jgi:hypothetical protein|nr:DUF3311 domain-containing protein [Verrucomicrobiae bacterium]
MKKLLLFLLIAAVYAVHQDIWNWRKSDPLILGFLPIGLAYHAAYTVVAAILMAILVKTAWPAHLEEPETPATKPKP